MDADVTIVLAGGDPADVPAELPPAYVIAADSGLAQAARLGLRVDLVVGDMDSVDPALLQAATAAGATLERHSPDKDATDLELALDAAARRGSARAVVVGGAGGRLDHLLANALLLGSARYAPMAVEWLTGRYRVLAVHDEARLDGAPDDLVTLLPVGGPARGVTTAGLRWRLDGDDLEAGSTRGVSNVLAAPTATIRVTTGTLLAIHRGAGP